MIYLLFIGDDGQQGDVLAGQCQCRLVKLIGLADGNQNRIPQGPPRDDAELQTLHRVQMLGHSGVWRVDPKVDMLKTVLRRQRRADLRRRNHPFGNQAFAQRHVKGLLVLQRAHKVGLINRTGIDQYPAQRLVGLCR